MRFESAELAKIAINFYLVSTVTTTNTLAEVCEEIGADWSEIVPALKLAYGRVPKAANSSIKNALARHVLRRHAVPIASQSQTGPC